MKVKNCRVCKNENLHRFLELGVTPLANRLLRKDQLNLPEPSYPLGLCFCYNCGLVQLSYVVPPEVMFNNYLWVSGTSDAVPVHFQHLADEVAEIVGLSNNSLVVDVGSNDGTLLKGFRNLGVKTLGIEPATNIAKIAEENGIETINDFFNEKIALKISEDKGKAKVITATNVVAHINDLDDLLKGINLLLDDDGAFVIEVPYLVDMIERNEFDTVYHEHLSYFAIKPLSELLKKSNMEIFDVKRSAIHGGSVRVYVKMPSSKFSVTDNIRNLLNMEEAMKLYSVDTYKEFADRVEKLKENLVALLTKLKLEGKTIVGYGAAAKGNTLLNYCKIDSNVLDYIADKNPLKFGMYTPGMHIPVVPVEKILEDNPDYVLILAWNFADEIIKQQQEYRDLGGKFIIPIPNPEII